MKTAPVVIVEDWYDCTHEERVERWENVLRVMDGLDQHARTKHFEMDRWIYTDGCGTVGCIAGHCSLDPYFWNLGLKTVVRKRQDDIYVASLPSFETICPILFGYDGFRRVFQYSNYPGRDEGYDPNYEEAHAILVEFILDLKEGRVSRAIRMGYSLPLSPGEIA